MKIKIIDETHIMLVASTRESIEYAGITRVFIDTKDSFVYNAEPSGSAKYIEKPEDETTYFNVSLDIGSVGLSTNELLVVYLETEDLDYPFVIPCYNNETLMHTIASKVGILDDDCECKKDTNKAYPIVLYYGFKLALSLLDIQTAIRYWNRIYELDNITSNCNCHGR